MFVKQYRCMRCAAVYEPADARMVCDTCGDDGILDIEFDYPAIKQVLTKASLAENRDSSIWRYLPLLPVKGTYIERALHVGMTPYYRAQNLETMFNQKRLSLKDDSVNPTASLKDRASIIAVMKAMECNHKVIACASTGNAATSLAGHAARMGLKAKIFVPKRAPKGKLAQLLAYGADLYRVDGDYKAAYRLSKQAIDHYGWYNRNAAINPHMVEGKKTVALEIAEQSHWQVPDWVVLSVGDGCTIGGVYKGFYDLLTLGFIDKMPRLLGVQSSGCDPFYQAWKNDAPLTETNEDTLADSIAVGIPRNADKGLRAVKDSRGAFITVDDESIMSAALLLARNEGVFAEPAAAAALAGYIKASTMKLIPPDSQVAIIISGNGLKDTDAVVRHIQTPELYSVDFNRFKQRSNKKEEKHE